ncbi:MAG: ribonuclease P protein component [Muribaculaceae bacterium]|nr:ribonuclease P protein component [Muribaculaceae bacterium]
MEKDFEVNQRGEFKFPKEERLHHRSLVEGLFRTGKSFYEFPFRVTWRAMNEEDLQKNFCNHIPEGIGFLQMMVSVPKKKRRHAVDRVVLRRRVREAYRLNRLNLRKKVEENPTIRTLGIGIVYIHNQNLPYSTIEDKMKLILEKVGKKIEV